MFYRPKFYRSAIACLSLFALQLPVANAELDLRQNQLLINNCVQCHSNPKIGAPLLGDTNVWNKRAKKGEAVLLKNVVEGIGGMPPLGYCSSCTEQDFRLMIRLMANLPDPQEKVAMQAGGSQ
jgi:cytochrome c5